MGTRRAGGTEEAVSPPPGRAATSRLPWRRGVTWLGPGLLGAALLGWPLGNGEFGLQIGSVVAIYALGVIGVDLVLGRAGMLQFGYSLFFGVGAYTVAIVSRHLELPTGVALLAGVVAAAVVAAVTGPLVVGIVGYLFGLVTLAAAAAVEALVRNTGTLGGVRGLAGISRNLFGAGPLSSQALFLLLVAVLLVAIGLYAGLRDSRMGRAFEAVRTVPHVAQASGVDIRALRTRAWIASGAIGGLAGGLFAVTVQFVSPEILSTSTAITFLVMSVVGGSRVAWAGIPGALLVRGLVQAVEGLQDYQLVIAGAATLAVIAWFPGGVAGTVQALWLRLVSARRAGSGAGVADVRGAEAAVDGLAPPPMEPLQGKAVRVRDLTVRFGGVVALDRLSLDLEPGRVTALVGPNGSGKSTFVNAVSGTLRPSDGTVLLDGEDLGRLRPARRVGKGITRTFQLVSLCDTLTALENVMVGGHRFGRAGMVRACVPRADAEEERQLRERALALMRSLGLGQLADRPASDLPSGPRRLVEIARCLMSGGSIVLLDEPASGLNPAERAHLATVIRALANSGRTVLLIEHDMKLVMNLADDVVVISDGVLLAQGAPSEIGSNEQVIRAYLGEAMAP